MSTHIKIITPKEVRIFDNPPKFNGEERKKFFLTPIWAKEALAGFKTPVNKIGFILQLGYFKAVNKFFSVKTFYEKDFEFVIRKLEFWV